MILDEESTTTKSQTAVATPKKRNIIRRMYNWVLHWAETPYGPWALFALSFSESSFFPIPPDVLLIALTISVRKKALKFALICSVGSILGGMFGYLIGFGFWNWVGDFFFNYIPGFSEARFTQIKRLYGTYDFLIVFTAGFTFIPYKIFTISSGVFKINFWGFLLASAISRSARFFIISGLIWRFGASIKRTIEKYFDYLAIVFILLLVAGFILIKLFFR